MKDSDKFTLKMGGFSEKDISDMERRQQVETLQAEIARRERENLGLRNEREKILKEIRDLRPGYEFKSELEKEKVEELEE